MATPRSLVYALYTHWDVVEVLVRQSRESMLLGEDQVLQSIGKVSAQRDAEAQATVLRALLNADILQNVPRSQDMQLHPYVLEFVRGLTREILTFCIISSLGGCESQVKSHVQGNVNVGNTKENLIDALTCCLPYIGFPRTLNALGCVNAVIPEN